MGRRSPRPQIDQTCGWWRAQRASRLAFPSHPLRSHTMSDPASLQALRTQLRGPLLLPADEDYAGACKVYNAMIEKKPAAIARCADVADVIACVHHARDHGLLLAVRGGGH